MGKTVEYDTEFKNSISDEVVELSSQEKGFQVITGDTMACDDFYEGNNVFCISLLCTLNFM